MKFELYSAVDTRDNKPTLWLVSLGDSSVALFNSKTAPSRIKRNSLPPNYIVWEHGLNFDLFADAPSLIDSWEWPE